MNYEKQKNGVQLKCSLIYTKSKT